MNHDCLSFVEITNGHHYQNLFLNLIGLVK